MATTPRLRALFFGFAEDFSTLSDKLQKLFQRLRPVLAAGAVVLVALLGVVIGLRQLGDVSTLAGENQINAHVGLSHPGQTVLDFPPAGEKQANTHLGPLGIDVQLHRLPPPSELVSAFKQGRLVSLTSHISSQAPTDKLTLWLGPTVAAVTWLVLMSLAVRRRKRSSGRFRTALAVLASIAVTLLCAGLAYWFVAAATSSDPTLLLRARTPAAALAGGYGLSLLVWRANRRRLMASCLVALAVITGAGVTTAVTFNPAALEHTTDTGYLALAPGLIGTIKEFPGRVQHANDELKAVLDTTAGPLLKQLPASTLPDSNKETVLWVSDRHLSLYSKGITEFLAVWNRVDSIIDTGDLAANGQEYEAPLAIAQLPDLKKLHQAYGYRGGYKIVEGNHDPRSLMAALANVPGVQVLDGAVAQVGPIRFFGEADPQFTPTSAPGDPVANDPKLTCPVVGKLKADLKRVGRIDAVLVHDQNMASGGGCETGHERTAGGIAGQVPLVLSGHWHQFSEKTVTGDNGESTLFAVTGTTGGGGLRKDAPYGATVLYFDRSTHHLVSYEKVTIDTDDMARPTSFQAVPCQVDEFNRSSCDPEYRGRQWPLSPPAILAAPAAARH